MTYTSITPYADEVYGIAYFAERLGSSAWDDATSTDRLKALRQATRSIDRLNFAGVKTDETQVLQFPRGNDTAVPDAISQACCELALAFLDDVDANLEVENLSNQIQGIGDLRVERDTSFAHSHIRAGIPSIEAWTLLVPFLRDPQIMDIDRS